MYKTDCFAYDKCGCRIFEHEDNWQCDNCSSFKTWKQCYEEQKKCEERLKAICKKFAFQYSIPKEILNEFRKEERMKKDG